MAATDIINSAQSYAAEVVNDAKRAMTDTMNLVGAVGYTRLNAPLIQLPATLPSGLVFDLPSPENINLELPASPGSAPVFQDIGSIDAGVLPILTATPPTLTLPTQPSQMAAFLDAPPVINTNITFPEPPSALINPIFDAPVLVERVEPVKPQTMLPSFDAAMPVGLPDAPTDLTASFEAAYREAAPSTIAMLNGQVDAMLTKHNPRYHEQMARIEIQLAKYMEGGTGLSLFVENAIYERARGKNDAEARRTRDAGYQDAASRGFTLPTGALMSLIQRARQAGADNNAVAGREIVVMQAEMEQRNLQFAITTSTSLRTAMLSAALNHHQNLISINGQALDYAKTTLSSIIEVYNIAVKAYSAKLDAYKAEAAVYEVRLKASLAGIELFKAEIDALQALANVDKAKIDVFRARIDSLTAVSNVYRSQIEAVQGRALLEKLKLEVFQSRVQAYTAQVQGKNAEWQGYSHAIDGQTALAKIFDIQVSAYGAQVNGYKAGIEAKTEVIKAAALTNKARAEQYSATLSGYSAVVQARGEVARTKLENNRQDIIAFQAQTQAAVANSQVGIEYYKAVSNIAITNAEMQMKAQIQSSENQTKFGATIANLSEAQGKTYASLAAAAMSGMNALAVESKAE